MHATPESRTNHPIRLELLAVPTLVAVGAPDADPLPGLLLARRGERCFVQVRRGAGDNVLRWLPATAIDAIGLTGSTRGDEQTLRPDPDRALGIGQHTGRQPRAAR